MSCLHSFKLVSASRHTIHFEKMKPDLDVTLTNDDNAHLDISTVEGKY